MPGSSVKPGCVGGKLLRETIEIEWIATRRYVSITICCRIVLDARPATRAFEDDCNTIFINSKIDAFYFCTRARHFGNLIAVSAISRRVTSKTKRGNHNLVALALKS